MYVLAKQKNILKATCIQ